MVFSQDTGAAGIATAAKIFHKSPVTSGQRPWFAAVLFQLGNLELEAQEDPGLHSPVLCHVTCNVVYGYFHEKTMLQLKTRLCFLPVTPSRRVFQTVHDSASQDPSCHVQQEFVPTYSGTSISFHFSSCFAHSSLLKYFYGAGSCLLSSSPQATQDWLFNLLS